MLLVPTPSDAAPAPVPVPAILHRPDILDVMASDLEAMGTVGETDNKQLLFLAMVSRLLPRPVNVVVKGPSSSGKSHLVRSVAELFPPQAVLQLSTMSPRALYYMAEDELHHRVLYVDEYMPHAGRDHALRLMQSEGRLVIACTLREGKAGFVTRTRTVPGPIAFITTTTRESIFDENETRAFSIETDGSAEQTKRIHDALRQNRSGRGPRPQCEAEEWRQAMEALLPYAVVIPFAEHIHLAPTGQARDRRDLGRILSVVEASALLHQVQRSVTPDGVLVADLEDYRVAYRLARTFLAPVAVDPRLEAVVAACRAQGEVGASHYDVMEALSWSRPTVIKYCQQAVAAGRLEVVRGANGGQKRYEISDKPVAGALTTPEEVWQSVIRVKGGSHDEERADG